MSPADKLAQSLSVLKALQDQQRVGIQSSELTRTHRERLLQQGFLREGVCQINCVTRFS